MKHLSVEDGANKAPQAIPTGWARVYAILSLMDGLCYGTNATLERCLLPKNHAGECEFPPTGGIL